MWIKDEQGEYVNLALATKLRIEKARVVAQVPDARSSVIRRLDSDAEAQAFLERLLAAIREGKTSFDE